MKNYTAYAEKIKTFFENQLNLDIIWAIVFSV